MEAYMRRFKPTPPANDAEGSGPASGPPEGSPRKAANPNNYWDSWRVEWEIVTINLLGDVPNNVGTREIEQLDI